MASPAKEARLAGNAKGFGTVIGRGRNSIAMSHNTDAGRVAYDTQIGVKFHFGSAPFSEAQEIDTAWVTGDNTPYRLKMVLADYNAFAGLDNAINFDAGQIVKYQHTSGANITFQPQQLQWTNDTGGIQVIGDVATVGATVTDNVLRWTNAFGTGRHFEWTAEPSRLTKKLIVDSLASLPTPNATILAGTNPVLRLQFLFQKSAGVDVYVDGVLWNEASNNPRTTTGALDFKSGTSLLWSFFPARVWDNKRTAPPVINQRVRKQGANLFVEVRVPWSWIQSAVFPIIIDPTVDEQVGADADDCWQDSSTTIANSGHWWGQWAGATEGSGWRFTTVNVANAVTINAGTVATVWASTAWGASVTMKIVGDAQDNAPAWSSTDRPNSITPTTASTAISSWPTGSSAWNDFSVTSIIQEIVNRAGWAANNSLRLAVANNGTPNNTDFQSTTDYSLDSTHATKLHIDYTSGGGGPVANNLTLLGVGA